jgi:diadenosine tetraphosphate (Ap4A) HIT family hydrolase
MTTDEAIDMFYTACHIAKRLEAHYGGTSLNFGIQDGPESGQSVSHVHMHIIPRRKGDFRKDQLYEKLRSHDKDGRILARSLEEMGAEAKILRKLFGYE